MRKQYLDNIRWIVILIVVVFHIFFYYNNIGIEAMIPGLLEYDGTMTFAGIFQYSVYPWFMLLLFVVAGISARCALKKMSTKQFLKARVDKILVPSTLGILAFGWIGGYVIYIYQAKKFLPEGTPAVVGVFITLLSGIGALWFCQVLFVATLVLLLLRCIMKAFRKTDDNVCGWFVRMMKKPVVYILFLILFYFILWGGSKILNMPMITSYRNGIYIPAFLMGYYVFSNDEIIDSLKKYVIPFAVLSIASGVFYIWRCYGLSYTDVGVLSRWDLNLFAYFVVLFVLSAGPILLNGKNKFTNYMKKVCFGIYVFHIPVMLVVNYLMLDSAFSVPLKYVIELVVSLGVSVLLTEVVSRIPILRYWILGIRKKKVTEKH